MSTGYLKSIHTVDSHTEGNATRVILGGVRVPPGRTLLDKRAWLMAHGDGLRRLLNFEPRGSGMMCSVLILPASTLGFAAIASVVPSALDSLNNQGPHGFSEILYAYTSATGNNGSAFAGLNAATPFYDITLGLAMLLGRFAMIVPMMAVAGALVGKKRIAASTGTFPTHTPLFIGLLVGVILIVGGLTYFPALSLGPIVEHFLMNAGKTF